MSENHTDCKRFEAWLLEGAPEVESLTWGSHLEGCSGCREQWTAHQLLVATFAEEAVPDLSPAFKPGLQRKIDATIEVRPLRGWRLAAMLGYATVAMSLMRWVLVKFPLPSLPLDPSSPWIVALAIAAVPLTLWMAIGVTRWLPAMNLKGSARLGLL